MKVVNVVGTRPNFMKVAPIMRAMVEDEFFQPVLLHTGQHYDRKMSKVFFEDLGMPRPDINLSVGSGTHGRQTGQVMSLFEDVVLKEKPELVLVVGDVNSTLAAALVAAKLHIPAAHVEAGLRSFDRRMPEEINRVLTDAICDFLFLTERSAFDNLAAEGIPREKAFFVGNVMIDTLTANKERAERSDILDRLALSEKTYALLTLHRPSNVDEEAPLRRIADALVRIGRKLPIVFPAHPRTAKNLAKFGLLEDLQESGVRLVEPMGYLDFLKAMLSAAVVLTDSGGLQEETTVLGVPCITLRENTERPITVQEGTNVLVGSDTERIVEEAEEAIAGGTGKPRTPELWDGKAAARILTVLKEGA